jgi:hypothetical protein
MSSVPLPAHAIPPAPILTSVQGGLVYWQGSAGARDYSVQRAPSSSGPWKTICRRCATDVDDGYTDVGATASRAWYRVLPYNLDGKPGRASKAMKPSPG